ncbi:MAG: ATP-binding protein [Thermodesulfobacteriota bacterium]
MREAPAILRNLLDGGVTPDDPRFSDFVYMRRMRTLNGMVLGLLVAALVTGILLVVSDTDVSILPVVVVVLVGVGVCVLVRWRLPLTVGIHVVVTTIMMVVALRQAEFGGLEMVGQAWVYLPPMVTGLILGVRGAAFTTVLITLQILIFAWLERSGVTFAVPVQGDVLPEYTAAVQILCGWAFFVVVCAFLSAQRSAERQLLLVNRSLEESRDRANEATRAKSRFLANMSHEIRTPMNVIFGMTEIIEAEGGLSPVQADCLARTRSAASTLLALVDDVLDVSRIEAGKMSFEVVELRLRGLLEEVADLLRPRGTAKGLSLTCSVAPDIPERLHGDPVRLKQIVTNLVGNAVKFTEQGEIALEAALVDQSATAATVRISVKDTGIGIPQDRQAAVFESFTQVDDSSTRNHGGTGLGLTICRELTQLMGGSIELVSKPGEGSEFRVVLPFGKQPGTPGIVPASAPAASPSAAT